MSEYIVTAMVRILVPEETASDSDAGLGIDNDEQVVKTVAALLLRDRLRGLLYLGDRPDLTISDVETTK